MFWKHRRRGGGERIAGPSRKHQLGPTEEEEESGTALAAGLHGVALVGGHGPRYRVGGVVVRPRESCRSGQHKLRLGL